MESNMMIEKPETNGHLSEEVDTSEKCEMSTEHAINLENGGDEKSPIGQQTKEAYESDSMETKSTKQKEVIEQHTNGVTTPKRKTSFSKLFSCGIKAKKKVHIKIENAEKTFNSYMTNINGFTNAVLYNNTTNEVYASMPNSFKLSKTDFDAISKIQRKPDEIFIINNTEYVFTKDNGNNEFFGQMKSNGSVIFGAKFNNKLLLLGTWSENDGNAKDTLIKCFNEIMKG